MEDEVVNIEIDSFDKLSIGRGCSIRQINKEGVYLLNPGGSNS